MTVTTVTTSFGGDIELRSRQGSAQQAYANDFE